MLLFLVKYVTSANCFHVTLHNNVQRGAKSRALDYTAIYVRTNSAQLIATGQKVYNPICDVVWY